MDACVLIFGGSAHWKLALDSPLLYEIPSSPGVQLISPLLFDEVKSHMDLKLVRSREPMGGFIDGLSLLETDGVAFKIEDDFVERYRPRDISKFASFFSQEEPPLIDTAMNLLRGLRYFSKQTGISTSDDDLNFWEWLVLDDLPTVKRREECGWSYALARSIVRTAITREHIEAACACVPGCSAPVYDGIFLDAVHAHKTHDYRASILYSAIALETAAAIMLDQYFETSIKPNEAKEWRMISRSIGSGKAVRKDPIWELLRKRDDANSLLHEGALYILGKSLLVENEALFQRVQCLRATRNKIVHEGEPPESSSNQYLPLDTNGSSDALDCVDAVLRWLGVGCDYGLHELGLIELSRSAIGETEEPNAS